MNSSIEWMNPVPLVTVAVILGGLVVTWFILRRFVAPVAQPARRWSLPLLRGIVLTILLVILFSPVQVDKTPGTIHHPDLFYLLDSSSSMALGQKESRWGAAQAAIRQAEDDVKERDRLNSVRQFRFGHQLAAIEGVDLAVASDGQQSGPDNSVDGPSDSDTRLSQALRQISGRFGRRPPAGVVLFSDGRVRDAGAASKLSEHFAARNVPIHVFPVGELGRGGDIAIVSVVVPQLVRKYSDVEVQVFFRSFGYTGLRSEVQLVILGDEVRPEETVVSLPITLRGGAQSVTLKFRSDDQGRKFEVRIPPQKDELSDQNNSMADEVKIDATKIRVLYIEGGGAGNNSARPHVRMQAALTQDDGIECVSLVQSSNGRFLVRPQTQQRAFPASVAELSAFDCVILSDVARESLSETQLKWLEDWVTNRGGGLCMVGGGRSYAGGRWQNSAISRVLPVNFEKEEFRSETRVSVSPGPQGSASNIWQIVSNVNQNEEVLQQIPPFTAFNHGLKPKPLAEVLATGNTEGQHLEPVIVAGQYGRGRALAIAVPATGPGAGQFLSEWGAGGIRYSQKFWRNVVYWLVQNSLIGRKRIVAAVDKQFYRLSETVQLQAIAYDETARPTTSYSVWGMVEPKSFDINDDSLDSPVRWPHGVVRESDEESPLIVWGEEFELVKSSEDGEYRLPLELADQLRGRSSDEGLRIELTAYESTGAAVGSSRGFQVDSTSLEIQILDDPFEQQNPFPNHDLLHRIASQTNGRILTNSNDLADVIRDLPTEIGPPNVSRVPIWNQWWLLAGLVGILSVEWFWRRKIGLA